MDIVLLHGWGLNKGVWANLIEVAEEYAPDLTFHALDLPGYGDSTHIEGVNSLATMAEFVRKQAPSDAIWLGWSLGGMVALQEAMQCSEKRIRGLYLLATSPCFVQKADWPHGVEKSIFDRFSQDLALDYRVVLSSFLLLQSGMNKGAREVARRAHSDICKYPDPTEATLKSGIDCLATTDLRNLLKGAGVLREIPSKVVSCKLDRVANPAGGHHLAQLINSQSSVFHSGHAPFLTMPLDFLNDLMAFSEAVG